MHFNRAMGNADLYKGSCSESKIAEFLFLFPLKGMLCLEHRFYSDSLGTSIVSLCHETSLSAIPEN